MADVKVYPLQQGDEIFLIEVREIVVREKSLISTCKAAVEKMFVQKPIIIFKSTIGIDAIQQKVCSFNSILPDFIHAWVSNEIVRINMAKKDP